MAGYICAAFVCFPRVSAASRILASEVSLPGDPRFVGMGAECFLVIGYDKREKTPRLVDVYDNLPIELLTLLLKSQPQNDTRIFGSSVSTLGRKLKIMCKDLGWAGLNFVPHSLRYGGVFHDKAVCGLSVNDFQRRGRWTNPDTCLEYTEKGLGRLFFLKLSSSSAKALRRAPKTRIHMVNVLRRMRKKAPSGG